MAHTPIKRVLVSVTNKEGLVPFVQALQTEFGVEVISTGGTFKVLQDAGVEVVAIDEFTGFPEMMDGRVKTLHPRVHGGLLAKTSNPSHMEQVDTYGIDLIDMVVVNLYEFEKTVACPTVTLEQAIEHIDIGGPSMLRSAAKNCERVTVVCDPSDYSKVLEEMRQNEGATQDKTRLVLAQKVFARTSQYDQAISTYLASVTGESKSEQGCSQCDVSGTFEDFPNQVQVDLEKVQSLRYGENPHQKASVYRFKEKAAREFNSEFSLVDATQLQGKPLSFNNLLDAEAAWNAVRDFEEPGVVILKHQNPCGSAVGANAVEAYDRAFACDPVSAFGGIIAVNREVTLEFVEHFADVNKQFVEVLIAPSYSPDALERLSARKNLRVLATGGVSAQAQFECRSIDGGLLVQEVDKVQEDPETFEVVTDRVPTEAEMKDLLFGWSVCKSVKSNAILIVKDQAGIGMGPGQPNRVDAGILACDRAHKACARLGVEANNLSCASDAFFPFSDNIDELAKRGVRSIIQPGGSIRDNEVIEACNEHGIAMVFTHTRHFRH